MLSVAEGESRNSVWLAQRGFPVNAFDVAVFPIAKALGCALREVFSENDAVADEDGFAWPRAADDDRLVVRR